MNKHAFAAIALTFTLFTSSAFALVQLKTELETESEKISPSVITSEDTWAEVETDSLLMRLKASVAGEKARIDAEISRKEGGKMVFLGRPTLIVRWDDSAQAAVSNEDGGLVFRLRVVPSQLQMRSVAATTSATPEAK
jgi:hypothetical protein